MAYGKLGIIKTIGNRPVFCILDVENKPIMTIPDLEDWMMQKIGHTVDLFVSNEYFQLSDKGENIIC